MKIVSTARNTFTHSRSARSYSLSIECFTPGAIETEYKVGHDPVTELIEQSIRYCVSTYCAMAKDGYPKRRWMTRFAWVNSSFGWSSA